MGRDDSLDTMEGWPEPGTPVRLVVKTWAGLDEHLGIALPGAGPGLVTVKLANGYNLSFPESYVESFEMVESVAQSRSAPGISSLRASASALSTRARVQTAKG